MSSLDIGSKPARNHHLAELLLDTAIAVCCYVLAYRVRFAGPQLRTFLPFALRTLPIVVGSQTVTLLALGVYRTHAMRSVLGRLVVGTLFGTLVGAAITLGIHGLTGISRAAFSADYLLLTSAVLGWRTGRALWIQRTEREDIGPALIDRARQRPTVGGTLASLLGHRELVRNLVAKDLKLKYRGSVLGFMWSLVNPLVMVTVYTIAFTYVIRSAVPGFVFFLLLGILAWNFFSSAATMSTGAIIDSGSLMKSVSFPRAILPIATVIFNFTQYLLTALVFLPVLLIVYRVPPVAPMLVYPVFLALQVLFTIGVALLLAAGTAFFRDIRHLLEIALAALFWMTPILYPLGQVHEKLRLLILLSPLSPFVVAYQQIFFYRQWPSLTVWVVGLAYSFGTFLLGTWLFLSLEDQFAEQL